MKRRVKWPLTVAISLLLWAVMSHPFSGQEKLPEAKPSLAPLQTKVKKEQVMARLEQSIPPLMKEADVPGLSLALVRDGELVWQHSFGVKNSKTKEPVTDGTLFEAASLSKPVFAYAVLKLVDSG